MRLKRLRAARSTPAAVETPVDLGSTTPAVSLVPRTRARVAGRVRSLRIRPWADAPTLEVTLQDPTGRVDLVFLGRRRVPGIRCGSWLVAEGTVGTHHGRLALMNPDYELVAPSEPAT